MKIESSSMSPKHTINCSSFVLLGGWNKIFIRFLWVRVTSEGVRGCVCMFVCSNENTLLRAEVRMFVCKKVRILMRTEVGVFVYIKKKTYYIEGSYVCLKKILLVWREVRMFICKNESEVIWSTCSKRFFNSIDSRTYRSQSVANLFHNKRTVKPNSEIAGILH